MIFASDIDKTLLYSIRGRDGDAGVVRAEFYDGRWITGLTRRALTLLEGLAARCELVMATTRSIEQFRRLRPAPIRLARWVVCANGGIVLRDGEVDRAWDARVRAVLRDVPGHEEVSAALAAALGECGAPGSWRLRERVCDGFFLYTICDEDLIPDGAEQAAEEALAALDWKVLLEGRKFYALPSALTKAAAVAYVREQSSDAGPLLAAGDSDLDRPMLALADRGFCPEASRLAALGGLDEHVVLTGGRGLEAAEALLDAVAAEVERRGAALRAAP